MRYLYTTVFFLLLTLFSNNTRAYCPPFFAEIDSINPKIDCLDINDRTNFCGGTIEVINHCNDSFYFYNDGGELNKTFLMVNREDRNKNYDEYNRQEEATGITIMGHNYVKVPSYTCPEPSTDSCMAGITPEELGFESGDTVTTWDFKIYSVNTDSDIVVTGRTIYNEGLDNVLLSKILKIASAVGFLLSFIMLILKVFFKRKISIGVFWTSIILSAALLFMSYIVLNAIG